MIPCRQTHCTVSGQYKFRTVTFLFVEFSFCLYKPHITTFCIFFVKNRLLNFATFVTVMFSLEKVLQDTRKLKIKCGIHFNKLWTSCGGTIHLFSTFCAIHRWVVSVTLYPNPYAHRMAGWVGPWTTVWAVVRRKVSAAAGCWLLTVRHSSLFSTLCELQSRHKLY
jgi:hypothetical protein